MRLHTIAAAAVAALALVVGMAGAQEMTFFRIGTGGIAGTYFPIGGLIANAISNPPGSRPCESGGSCGVPGLIATAMTSNGSLANIKGIDGGAMEAGFSQSDVAFWAYTSTGAFEGKLKVDKLRAIANLYPESIHLVARTDAGIKSVANLKGKRVSLDEPGSGTLVDARLILAAYGLTEKDFKAEYLKPNQASLKMKDGAMDAFFFVGGYPTEAVSALASTGTGITLVPIAGPEAARMRAQHTFFAEDRIPAGTYKGVGETPTLAVGAQLLAGAGVDNDLIYGITKTLWNDSTRKLLDTGHAKGRLIQLKTALDGIGIPLHPGAETYYREVGMLK